MDNSSGENQTGTLLDTLARVLAPVVRLMIAKGVTYQMASELLKRVYVKVAQAHFVDDDAATGTKLSLITGLNRKEIRRLTSDAEAEKRPEDMTSYAAAAYALWRSDRRWRERDGKPKTLPRRPVGRQVSFDDLVRSITTDHRPSAVLDELIRLGFVYEDDQGNVNIKSEAFLPQQNMEDKFHALAGNLEDHANAAVLNVLSPQPEFLERSIFSDELSLESAEELARLSLEEWQRIHDSTIERAIAAETKDAETGRPGVMRIRLGMYFYAEKKKDNQ